MQQAQESGKRIVSKGEYAIKIGNKLVLSSFGVVVFLIGVFCVLCTIGIFAMGMIRFKVSNLPGLVFAVGFMGGLSILLCSYGVNAVQEAKQADAGTPLTRANTGDLPEPESLVRASQEPPRAQKDILLRAATGQPEAHQNQLLRASAESQEENR